LERPDEFTAAIKNNFQYRKISLPQLSNALPVTRVGIVLHVKFQQVFPTLAVLKSTTPKLCPQIAFDLSQSYAC
jgi:hypothetical protein